MTRFISKDVISILEITMSQKAHCGICKVEWEEGHEKTQQHINNANKFDFAGYMEKEREKIIASIQPKENDPFMKFFKNIGDAYAIIEFYEMGSCTLDQFKMACKYALNHFEKKYGKNDFRYRHLFAHMQGDYWTDTFEIRNLVHAESIGCMHSSIDECNKYKTEIDKECEISVYGKLNHPCQHCRTLQFRKEEWEKK